MYIIFILKGFFVMKKQLLMILCTVILACAPITIRSVDNDSKFKNDAKIIACVAIPAIATYFAALKNKSVVSCVLICALAHAFTRNFVSKDGKGETALAAGHLPLLPLQYASNIVAKTQKALADSKVVPDAKNTLLLWTALAQ